MSLLNNVGRPEHFFSGFFVIPSKQGFLTLNDPEFEDRDDFPSKSEDFAEPWISHESNNEQGLGFGVIWDPNQTKEIIYSSHWGPSVEYKRYDLKPGETIRTGQVAIVIGQVASRLTRRTWLKEFNGREVLNRERDIVTFSHNLLDLRCGEELRIPGLDQNPLSIIALCNIEKENLELEVMYSAKRETPLNINVELSSKLWDKSIQHAFILECGKRSISFLPLEQKNASRSPMVIHGKISLPYNERQYTGIVIPYNSDNTVILEKRDNFWSFSNNYLNFKASNTHGASLYSAEIETDRELFFSRYPNKESFTWFKNFVGGLHPLITLPGWWNQGVATQFFNNKFCC